MQVEAAVANYDWLCTGDEMFRAMLESIRAATKSVCLETYTFEPGALADRFRESLAAAARRQVDVRVLVDALGSINMPAAFWTGLGELGIHVRQFNPLHLRRLGIRNHRKLLVVDSRVAFVGGFNISQDYEGDGVTRGWCDLGLRLEGALAVDLGASFEEMYARAELKHKLFLRLRRLRVRTPEQPQHEQLLLSSPEQRSNQIKRSLRKDLANARDVCIISAYFLPTWRLRWDLMKVVRRGGRLRLLLPGKSDVLLSQLAARSLYRRFLKAGIRIFEYQPQVLHAKLFVIDDIVYVGSANMDARSLSINYELMVRFQDAAIAGQAREVFNGKQEQSVEITRESWRSGTTLWRRLKQRWAYFILARLDPYIARRQWQALPD